MGKNNLSLETNKHFTIIIDDIIYDKNLTAYEKLLYVILKTYTNKNTNTIFPSHKTLSENMNVSIFTVKKAIQGLIEKGYLKKKSGKRGIKGTKDTSNTYTLIEKVEEKKELSHATTPVAQESKQFESKTNNKSIKQESQEEKQVDSENIENEDIEESQEEKKKRVKQEEKKQTELDGSGMESVNIESQKWHSDSKDSKEVLAAYETLIKNNIEYENLCNAHQHDKAFIDELISNILDVVMSHSKTIKIQNEYKNAELVKSVLLKLNYYQIEYVIQKYHQITTKITNKRQYILTMLYNAHLEAESSVINEVANDLSVLPNKDIRDRKKDIEYLENYLL